MEYNPFYDNTYEANRKPNTLAFSAKTLLQEQKQQIVQKEESKLMEKQKQWEQERRIQDQQVAYLQNPTRKDPTQEEKREIIRQIEQKAQSQGGGGYFTKVFDLKEQQQQLKQQQQQQYVAEIRRQIEEKQKIKEEQLKKQKEEDEKYELRVQQDLEKQNERFRKEDEKKLSKIHREQPKDQHEQMQLLSQQQIQQQLQQQQLKEQQLQKEVQQFQIFRNQQTKREQNRDQSKLYNEFEEVGNITNIVPNYLKDPKIMETDERYDQVLKSGMRNRTPLQQEMFQPTEYRPIVPGMLEQYQRQYEELKMFNRMKNQEFEDNLDKIKRDMEVHQNVWNDELRRLRAEVQVSAEGKNKAFYELENLKDHLRRQELQEAISLNTMKKNLGLRPESNNKKLISDAQYLRQTASRQYGVPTNTDNKISSHLNTFEQRFEY